ncbi:ABC transporter B family member 2 [Spatholobus suberectus]|nr:ABC transporter B family member 2 [Spatholobus suberectus]
MSGWPYYTICGFKVICNVRTVQAFAGEERAVRSYKAALMNTYRNGRKAGLAKGLGLGSMHCVLFLSWALLVWFTSIVVHKNIANGGDAFTTMLNVVISGLSLGQTAPDISAFIRAKAAAYPIFEMIQRDTMSKVSTENGQKLSQLEDSFRENFSSCRRSGSGKSTVISLIERFYEPLSGQILLDRNNIRELDLTWLRQQIGLVNQEPALFATIIRENILYGKDDATLEEINQAVRLSDAHSFINNLPDGLDTQVGERGIQLSGGQKQRIAISRAIIKNPSILLLDEATSALDAESEKSVQEALDRVMVGRTTVIVAHRLSTIRNADMIAVTVGGKKVVEIGNHEELISNPNNVYASLVQIQETAFSQGHVSCNIPLALYLCLYDYFDCNIRRLGESSSRSTSFRGSFRSDKESTSRAFGDGAENVGSSRHVSARRQYSMIGPDWLYGVFGTLAYYMDWDTTRHEVKKVAFVFCGAAVLTITAHAIEHLSFGIMGERLTLQVREKMFSAILKSEIGWFDDTNNTSSMLSSLLETDATFLRTVVVDRSMILLQNVGLVVASFIIAFMLNWRITLVVLATYPLIISGHISKVSSCSIFQHYQTSTSVCVLTTWVPTFQKLFMQGFGGNLSKAYLKANMLAGEAVSNIRTVAAFCAEQKILDLYANELVEPSKRSFNRGQIAGVFYGISEFFIFSSYGLASYESVLMGNELSSFKSIMKSFMVLIVTALAMGETLALAPGLLKGNQMVASIFEVMDRKTVILGDVGEELKTVEGTIGLKRIQFSYLSRPDVVIFNDFNLTVPAGKNIALVGHSGCGKSSVISLILRFYDPTSGKVMVDGKDIKKLNLKSLRKHIGLVQQEPALFATSIYENILYGKEGASEAEVIEAAKLANTHSFISALPEGYSTKVDEATSALDLESERVVQQALDKLMQNRTTVIVAHRLSTIRNADQIAVLEDGKIIERGTHSREHRWSILQISQPSTITAAACTIT